MQGGTLFSPWSCGWEDTHTPARWVTVTITFNNSTRALISATIHRDSGCAYTRFAVNDPTSARVKFLNCPGDGQPDATYTAAQMATQGLNTIENVLSEQVTLV
jgi:hypothetical protein